MNRSLALKTTHSTVIMASCSLLLATTMAFNPSAEAAATVVVTTGTNVNVTPAVSEWPYYTGPCCRSFNTVNVNKYYKGSGYKGASVYHHNHVYHSNRYRSPNANGGVNYRGLR